MKFNLQLFGLNEDYVTEKIGLMMEDYNDLTQKDALELVKVAQLERIADYLEGIDKSLESMSNLVNVTGDVSTYEG